MDLPIKPYLSLILETVRDNIATVIHAETGAGKSTEVPAILSQEFRVIVTQPRIVAAVELARRVADNLGRTLGTFVGYASSEEHNHDASTRILFVTDGLQLSRELHRSDLFPERTVLVIDEIHEWNQNIELLVALAKSRGIHVVLMSATLEAEKLSSFMNGAPIIGVPGRSFKVTQSRREAWAMLDEISSAVRQGENVLVFLPGKREIADLMTKVTKELGDYECTLLPLHGELSPEERSLVFSDLKKNEQRVVFATNIAQTSLTIPYITMVVDCGQENRVEIRNGVEGLGLAEISLADIKQRAGRAGRVRDGKYVLCSDYDLPRREFPVAEIERTELDMTYLRLLCRGIVLEDMNLFHQPSFSEIARAKQTLIAFNAITMDNQVTPLGHLLAKMPVGIRSGVMLLRAAEAGVISEITTIVAILEAGDLRNNDGPWYSHTKEKRSDLLANLDLYNFGLKVKAEAGQTKSAALREQGISSKNFHKAKNTREMIVDACMKFMTPNRIPWKSEEQKRQEILNVIRHGFRDSIYERTFGQFYGPSGYRKLDQKSVISYEARWVVGMPFDLSGKNSRGEFNLRLLIAATEVDEQFVQSVRTM